MQCSTIVVSINGNIFGKVGVDASRVLLRDLRDQHCIAKEELILNESNSGVFRVGEPHWTGQ